MRSCIKERLLGFVWLWKIHKKIKMSLLGKELNIDQVPHFLFVLLAGWLAVLALA